MPDKQLLRELLVQEGNVSQEVGKTALRVEADGIRVIGHLLVRMKVITPDQLATTLAKELEIDVADISDNFEKSAAKTLPRYICHKYDVPQFSIKGNNILELAMANPSGAEAISNLEHYAENVVEPRLAFWSDIDSEIGRKIPWGMEEPISNTLQCKP